MDIPEGSAHPAGGEGRGGRAGPEPAAGGPLPSTDPAGADPLGAPAPDQPAHRSVRARVITAAVAVAVAIAGFFAIRAATSHSSAAATSPPGAASRGTLPGGGGRGGGLFGTLQAVNGSTLVVADRNGKTTKVSTSSSTRVEKATTGAVGDLKVGDHVMASGTTDSTGAITAQRITDTGTAANGPGFGRGPRAGGDQGGAPDGARAPGGTRPAGVDVVAGTVKSVDGTTVTVTANDGTTATVKTGPNTTVSLLRTVTLGDLTIGQPVTVAGTTDDDGTVTARAVTQGLGGFGRRGGFPGGGGGAPARPS